MNKRERFYAAVAGAPVDRPPLSVWMHFVTPYATGLQGAARHCEFLRQYDWDLAKAVSDYRHPLPDGMETITTPADMARITVQSMDHPTYANQIALLNGIRAELGEDWPVVDTTFDPIQQVLRHAGFSALRVILDNPRAARPMLEAVTETVIRYMRELAANGIDGVFYSTRAAATEACVQGYARDAYEELLRPYDLAILGESRGVVRMLHACKNHLDLDRVADYPHEVLSWAAHDPTCPTIAEMRQRTGKCIMGGIDQARVVEQSRPEIRCDIDAALAVTGGRNFILAPGCTFGSNAPAHVFDTIAEYGRDRDSAVAA